MLAFLSLSGCASMTWHEGSMIQYSEIKPLEDNGYSIEVLGGYDHDQESLERAVLKKADKLCGGTAVIESSSMSTYYSGGAAGGVAFSGNPPKINSFVKCK
jgi:uncharacterized OsmC-like protein